MVAERTKKWERRSDTRPAELIAAALRLFAERGFAATRLDDVAAAAGVSKATVYLYFDNKERLFEAVVRAAITPSLEHAAHLVDVFDGPTPNLLRTLLGLFEAALDGPFPSIAKLIIAESGNFPELAKLWHDLALSRALGLLRKVIERGIARGEFRRVDPAVYAPLIAAPVVLLGIWQQAFAQHAETALDRHAVLAAHLENILRGLAPPVPGRARKGGEP